VALEALETRARLTGRPELLDRAPVPMDCHGSMEAPATQENEGMPELEAHLESFSLRNANLRLFDLSSLPLSLELSFDRLGALDLSRNELWSLPSLAPLTGLTINHKP